MDKQKQIEEKLYFINGKQKSKADFDSYVNNHYKKEFIEEKLNKYGECRVESETRKKSKYSDNYDFFSCAPKVVFDMEEIIAQNEYDPLDDDAFSIAFALCNAGYRKIPEGAVVLTDEEYERWQGQTLNIKKVRKETAEKFAEKIKEELYKYLPRDEDFEFIVDEICKELEGENGSR